LRIQLLLIKINIKLWNKKFIDNINNIIPLGDKILVKLITNQDIESKLDDLNMH